MVSGDLIRYEPPDETAPAVIVHTDADLIVSESTRARVRDGVAENTRRAYRQQWNQFADWCTAAGRVPVPATEETLADYVGHLCDEGKSPATIEQAISVIRTRHTINGMKGHPETRAAKLALRHYKRERAENGQRNQRASPPVTIAVLRAMIDTCDTSTLIGLRDRALLITGLGLMGRRSELAALMLDDVDLAEDGIEITIRTSKTDKDSLGETIAIPRGAHPLTDPVAAWGDWVDALTGEGITDGRLLRRVDRHGNIGTDLKPDGINNAVRKLALAAEVPRAEEYTAHSLRAGGATVAYAAGVPLSTIARHGRWKPDSPVLLRYIRAVDRWKDNAMRDVGL